MKVSLSNPYLEDFYDLGGDTTINEAGLMDDIKAWAKLHTARPAMLEKYAYAIPDYASIAALVALGPIVEIGAGRGYWASLIAQAGVDIVAYDNQITSEGMWRSYQDAKRELSTYHPVSLGDGEDAAKHSDRALLLIWPPYGNGMADLCLELHRKAGGTTVAYVGEWGGCTADDAFHDQLEEFYDRIESISIPKWPGMHDRLTVWKIKEC